MTTLEFPYLSILPYAVLSDKDLRPNAKIFYSCLVGLAKKEGYCWASNQQLAEMMQVQPRAIRLWLESLEKKGFIRRDIRNIPHKEQAQFFWKKERKIFVNDGFSNNACDVAQKDRFYDVAQKDHINSKSLSIKKKERERKNPPNFSHEITKTEEKKASPKIAYSEYVLMTEDEYKSLVTEFGETFVKLKISSMDTHCAEKEVKVPYKNCYLKLKAWCAEDKLKSNKFSSRNPTNFSRNLDFAKLLIEKNPNLASKGMLNLFNSVNEQYFEIALNNMNWTISLHENGFRDQIVTKLNLWNINYEV